MAPFHLWSTPFFTFATDTVTVAFAPDTVTVAFATGTVTVGFDNWRVHLQ